MMKRLPWLALVLGGIVIAGGFAHGQGGSSDPTPDSRQMPSRHSMMGGDKMTSMGPGMSMGAAMGMGPGMGMGGGCPMMMPDTDISVQKLPNGASISVTSNNPKVVSRIQKRAEIARLMHELQQEEQ